MIKLINKKFNLNLGVDFIDKWLDELGSMSDKDEELIKQVYENEKLINLLEECITTYLVKLSKCILSDKEKVIVASTFHIIIDIERIGDHAENIADLAVENKNKKLMQKGMYL